MRPAQNGPLTPTLSGPDVLITNVAYRRRQTGYIVNGGART